MKRSSGISHPTAAMLLTAMDLGSSVAESDTLLETARVETSVFDDLLADHVDLIPGTKGSGKTALYRIFVDFLAPTLLERRKVVIAHGVSGRSDNIFLAFKEQFESLSESDFVDYWCLYLCSLAHEQFIKDQRFSAVLDGCNREIAEFRDAYLRARIPEFPKPMTLRDILAWGLVVLKSWKPKLTYKAPHDAGQLELTFEGSGAPAQPKGAPRIRDDLHMPKYIEGLVAALDHLLERSGLSLWLMMDRLDELFPRRSSLEKTALRGLLRTLPYFQKSRLRVKVFLRDDIFEQVVGGDEGFTALTHVTARTANTLKWSEDQILAMLVRRIFSSPTLARHFKVKMPQLRSSATYQRACFKLIFPDTIYGGSRQSSALRWIYNHTRDGRGVTTPRDVIDLVTRASEWQRDRYGAEPSGRTERLLSGEAIRYGMDELSRRKRTHFLEAEFPHLWPRISPLVGGGTEYSEGALQRLFGKNVKAVVSDLESVGVLYKTSRAGRPSYKVPFLYRRGLEVSQRYVSV